MDRGFLKKRILDLFLSTILLFLLSPLLVTIALLVRWRLGSPVVFRQLRPGLRGQPFTIYKFRTMTSAKDRDGNLLSDQERLTAFGSFLRSSSLDELPELLNVLQGNMSLVGPRPLRMAYLERYNEDQARRHDVLPGITGWAQVNGRNSISWEEKFKLDVEYVDRWSIRFDVWILWLTLIKVLKREGIDTEGFVSAPEFLGNEVDNPESGG